MRIDSHVHGDPANLASPRKYRAACRKAGIDGIVLISRETEGLFDAVKKMGDFVIPVATVDPDRVGVDGVHRLLDRGAAGIKFIAPRHAYRDERYYPLYEAIRERGRVAVFHTGYLMHTPDYNPKYRAGMDDMRAAHIDTLLRWVPGLKVLMAHYGNPNWEECWKVSISHPNLCADLSGGTAIHRSMLLWRELFAPNGKLSTAAMEHLCFGTDLSYFLKGDATDPRIAQYVDFHERLFDQTGTPPALRERVNSGNILALFDRA
jgi:predicted TIM-barrel fold metal-dependent hydrolase